MKIMSQYLNVLKKSNTYPSIAQLAERETVEAKQLSLGHWFESGSTEIFSNNFPGFKFKHDNFYRFNKQEKITEMCLPAWL